MGYIGVKPAGISSASQVETNLLDVDNITIDGNTISSTDTNGDITLDPDGTGDVAFNANASFGDNNKAVFGAGNDLQIYHDGTHSRLYDNGTGDLKIQTNGTGVYLTKGVSETMAKFLTDGAVTLYYDNAAKLDTTSTGIDVTGDVLADTVTLDNGASDWQFSVSGNNLIISYAGTNKAKLDSSGNLTVVGNVTAYGTV